MKYKELDNRAQVFLKDMLDSNIEEMANSENVGNYCELSEDEYEKFFDDYDEDYEMVDGFPSSTIETSRHNKYAIGFENQKVILQVYPREEDECDNFYSY